MPRLIPKAAATIAVFPNFCVSLFGIGSYSEIERDEQFTFSVQSGFLHVCLTLNFLILYAVVNKMLTRLGLNV